MDTKKLTSLFSQTPRIYMDAIDTMFADKKPVKGTRIPVRFEGSVTYMRVRDNKVHTIYEYPLVFTQGA